jgi:hypothetical protein
MNKEFVPYEQAVALKELGFDEPCFGYWKMSDWLIEEKPRTDGYTHADQLCSAPLYQQAFRWFREKYELHSFIYSDFSWNISGGMWDLDGYVDSRYDWDSEPFKTFEEAELACLSKLIGIVKENIKYESNTRIQS